MPRLLMSRRNISVAYPLHVHCVCVVVTRGIQASVGAAHEGFRKKADQLRDALAGMYTLMHAELLETN